MNATPTLSRRTQSEIAVLALTAMALVLGWWLRAVTLYRTDAFTVESAGIAGRAPHLWWTETGADPLWSAHDARGRAFETRLELRTRGLAADADPLLALDALTLERATTLDAYKTLGADWVYVHGQAAAQRAFTYVEVDRNPYVDRLPVVVRGLDVALRAGDRVVIVTYIATLEAFDADYRYFRSFVEALTF